MEKIKKEEIIETVAGRLKKASGVYLLEFEGIKVSEISELRENFRKCGAEYQVVKNTLIKKAIERSGISDTLVQDLKRTTGLVFSYEDPIAAGKMLEAFCNKYEKASFKAALIEGAYFESDKLSAISSMSTKEESLARVGGVVKQVISGTPSVVYSVIRNVAFLIKEIHKDKNQESSP